MQMRKILKFSHPGHIKEPATSIKDFLLFIIYLDKDVEARPVAPLHPLVSRRKREIRTLL